jgi:aldose 1-epimerase
MCNHAYWNLSGGLVSDVKGHTLQLRTPFMLPVNSVQIPTGEVRPVAGTPFDFSAATPLGARIAQVDGGGEPGFDHNFCRVGPGAVPADSKYPLDVVATLADPASGRVMTVSTDCPGLQVYT